jgi:hypothetical protein
LRFALTLLLEWLLREGEEEAARAVGRYWRAQDLGPVPPGLQRWDVIDRQADAEIARRRREEAKKS